MLLPLQQMPQVYFPEQRATKPFGHAGASVILSVLNIDEAQQSFSELWILTSSCAETVKQIGRCSDAQPSQLITISLTDSDVEEGLVDPINQSVDRHPSVEHQVY